MTCGSVQVDGPCDEGARGVGQGRRLLIERDLHVAGLLAASNSSAVNVPARPPPIMATESVFPEFVGGSLEEA
eukprot:CAMPEP_0206609796 /NCGR_PEP_ID=MMETSP0325_2-20121206/54052_1 /ASSEMBLY_ACC=CAM_ASM_000347 /TAXON_ID=2866 /ORGANISM="Crypthecodinium cohnii, Strain Seligo" /LENGTH=72 /DNA_ID=CAMNT_0054128255 /DNA_START=554 /DNA_END=769 /DNA_ORIENTATION=-